MLHCNPLCLLSTSVFNLKFVNTTSIFNYLGLAINLLLQKAYRHDNNQQQQQKEPKPETTTIMLIKGTLILLAITENAAS